MQKRARFLILLFVAATVSLGVPLLGETRRSVAQERLKEIFSPLRVDKAALSPDGKLVAYTQREGDDVYVIVVPVDAPETTRARVKVADREHAELFDSKGARGSFYSNYTVGRVEWMAWISPQRLAVHTNLTYLSYRPARGALYAFNFDGSDAKLVHGPKYRQGIVSVKMLNPLNSREAIVELDGDEYASIDLDRGTLRTLGEAELGRLETLNKEKEHRLRPFEVQVRTGVLELLPDHKVSVLGSLESQARALVMVQSVADPGGFLVYEPASRRLWDFVRRANANTKPGDFRTEWFCFGNSGECPCSGFITLPLDRRVKKAPLILLVPEKLGAKVSRDYRAEVHAFSAMGFAVAVVDGCREGNATKAAKSISERDELKHLADTLDILASHYPVSKKAVALFGERLAGRRALSLIALCPGRFRCLTTILPDVAFKEEEDIRIVCRNGTPPIQGLLYFGIAGSARDSWRGVATVQGKVGVKIEMKDIAPSYAKGDPAERARVFGEIENFLNWNLYNYSIELGEIEVVDASVSGVAPE